jgi:hypothetical protein
MVDSANAVAELKQHLLNERIPTYERIGRVLEISSHFACARLASVMADRVRADTLEKENKQLTSELEEMKRRAENAEYNEMKFRNMLRKEREARDRQSAWWSEQQQQQWSSSSQSWYTEKSGAVWQSSEWHQTEENKGKGKGNDVKVGDKEVEAGDKEVKADDREVKADDKGDMPPPRVVPARKKPGDDNKKNDQPADKGGDEVEPGAKRVKKV